VDSDPAVVATAQREHPDLDFVSVSAEQWAGPVFSPDGVIISLVLDEVDDVVAVLERIHGWSGPQTRVIVTTYNRVWRPLLALLRRTGLMARRPVENYLPWMEMENLAEIAGFEVVRRVDGILIPVQVPFLSHLVNRWLAPLPLLRALCLIRVTVLRPLLGRARVESVSVIVPARNEAGNIPGILSRTPELAPRQEIIFVEGGSTDGTWDVLRECAAEYAGPAHLVLLQQEGRGKGDAVRTGFAAATGDVVIILDADLSVPPEELPRFIDAIAQDRCEFANGSRLVYPRERRAMRTLNLLGNRLFGVLLTFLLGQPVRDTLCGTKALRRTWYERIAANRATLGESDPFGDFDLLFGATLQGMRIRDIPIHYRERQYGQTNISRFRDGLLLLRMTLLAARRITFASGR